MNTILWLMLGSLIPLISSQLSNDQNRNDSSECCLPPITLLSLAQDLREEGIFPLIQANFYIIVAGKIERILLLPGVSEQLYFDGATDNFPWIMISYEEGIYFNSSITSSNTEVLLNPFLLPYSSGLVPLIPERSHLLFECVGTTDHAVEIELNLTFTSNISDVTYCPISFSFGKECSSLNMISSGEIEDFSMRDVIQQNVSLPPFEGCNVTMQQPMPTVINQNGVILSSVLASVVAIVIIIIAVVAILTWGIWYYRIQQRSKQLELSALAKAYMDARELWIPMTRDGHQKEFPSDQINILRQLGEGAFSVVYEATADGIEEEGQLTQVAIKKLHDVNAMNDFFREVDFMSQLDHPNVVRLLGVCSIEEPYYMIFEYMDLGDLCSFLRNAALLQLDPNEVDVNLTMSDMLDIIIQVAQGMEYIAKNNYVHRDLSARNCLVSTGLVVKIADFGMSRNLYSQDYYRVQGSTVLPVRWMSPESIKFGKFTEASDVWSFGVLMWEIFSLGQQPFTGYTNEEVIEFISNGGKLKPPVDAGPVASVMTDCWEKKPKKRPKFNEALKHLKTIKQDITMTIN